MAKAYGKVENLMYLFIHHWNDRQYEEIAELFVKDKAEMILPDQNVGLEGKDEIRKYVERLKRETKYTIHFPHTAYFEEKEEGEICGEWETITYFIDEETETSQYMATHMTAEFKREAEGWRIKGLWWRVIYAMKSEAYMEKKCCNQETALPYIRDINQEDSSENIRIQQIMNRISQSIFLELGDYLAEEHEIEIQVPQVWKVRLTSRKQVLEAIKGLSQNIKNRKKLPITLFFAPVIERKDIVAEGCWYVYTTGICYDINQKARLDIGIAKGYTRMIKESNEWKITNIRIEEQYKLKTIDFVPETRYQRYFDGRQDNAWERLPEVTGNNECNEDIYEIASIFAHWIIDMRGNPCDEFVDEYMINSKENCCFSLQANGPALARNWNGNEQVREMAAKMSSEITQEHIAGGHMAALPVIEVSPDGLYAETRFWDYNCALRDVVMTKTATGLTLENQEIDLKQLPYLDDYDNPQKFIDNLQSEQMYLAGISRYYHRFVKENGKWKLYDFCWTPQLVFPDCVYSKTEGKGWGAEKNRKPFPVLGTKIACRL